MVHDVAGQAHPGTPVTHAAAAAEPDPRRWRALALLAVAQFMVILDISVVNVALPDIGAALGLEREGLTWVITAYTLCFGGLMIFGGRSADLLGSRRTFLAGLAVFTAASALAGLTRDGSWLIAARGFQGAGAALLSPAALATVTAMFSGHERYRALGVWAGLGGAGAAVGVLLGGVLVSGPGWPWIFYVNVPTGLAVLALAPRIVPPTPARPGRLDVAGAVLVTGGLGAVIYGLIKAGSAGWSDAATLVPLAAGALTLAVFAVVERSVREPLVRPELVARRPVASGLLTMTLATALLIASFFLGSMLLQRVLGLSALEVGVTFLPVALATGAGAHLGSRLLPRVGPRAVAAGGFTLAGGGLFLMSRIDAGAGVVTGVLPGFVLAAFALGTAFVVATTTALAAAPAEHTGALSATVNTSHELGASLGAAVFSAVAGASLTVVARPAVDGFDRAFAVAAVTALVAAAVLAVALPAGRPAVGDQPLFAH